jgi:hypothetical protein
MQTRTKYQYYTLKGTERSRGDAVHAFSAEVSLVRGVALGPQPPHGRLVLCPPFGAPLECQQVGGCELYVCVCVRPMRHAVSWVGLVNAPCG